ncbi:phenylalanine 4-monooxygenase [Abyssibius alkaniclasticus]|uniref:phenylalanine 4-monooxygenase n=1 Tax=Abyssibius alkaniclasticus TaxID=2881234 RepID=UPI002363F3AD|nr:phenylalanine 4-monooxygenase [Abyssibius alkaniclasticus]UPH72656.1 phenylalanine 4-monooxygenase [Abyssibius alkaniclasticus]
MAQQPYESKFPDAGGIYSYSKTEDDTWQRLVGRQIAALGGLAVDAYFDGVEILKLDQPAVPQVAYINAALGKAAGFGVEGVPALISPKRFYELLSERKFPVATFLRRPEDMDYLEEPDIFHEVFGHCPLLTNRAYTDFVQAFGKAAGNLGKGYSWHMFRLFWFTVEFGMIRTAEGLRAYGAGIVSSPSELEHAFSDASEKLDFDLQTALRTPYRIDIVQPVYFVIDSFEALPRILDCDIKAEIDRAKELGDLPPRFEPAKKDVA